MVCPKCGSEELKVNESRDLDNGNAIRRRRECLNCANRFTTYERIENPKIMVIKRDDTQEVYRREKILSGVKKALVSRPFNEAAIDAIVDDIERMIIENYSKEIESSQIGKIVIRKLRDIDQVAYLRFVSVYKKFDEPDQFIKELESLNK
jgi:transcriptional repressor NrdR